MEKTRAYIKISRVREMLRIFSKNTISNMHCQYIMGELTQPAITCSKLTIETLEQGVKYVQS